MNGGLNQSDIWLVEGIPIRNLRNVVDLVGDTNMKATEWGGLGLLNLVKSYLFNETVLSYRNLELRETLHCTKELVGRYI